MGIIPHSIGPISIQPTLPLFDHKSHVQNSLLPKIIFNNESNQVYNTSRSFNSYFEKIHKKYDLNTTNIENLVKRLLENQDQDFEEIVQKKTIYNDTFFHKFFQIKTPLGEVLQELESIQEHPNRKLLPKELFLQAEKEAVNLIKNQNELSLEKKEQKQEKEKSFLLSTKLDEAKNSKVDQLSNKNFCPKLIGSYYNRQYWSYDIALNDDSNLAFVASEVANYGLQFVDLIDKLNPKLMSFYPTNSKCYSVAANENNAYLLEHSYGLRILNASDSKNPKLVGNLPFCSDGVYCNNIVLSKHKNPLYAYVTYDSGLKIINVTDSFSPKIESSIDIAFADAIDVSSNNVFLGTKSEFKIIDVNNKTNPNVLSSLTLSYINDLVCDDKYVYLVTTGKSPSFIIIDVSNLKDPKIISSIQIDNLRGNIAKSGSFVYLTADLFFKYDVSNVYNPKFLGSIERECCDYGITIKDNYAYLVFQGPYGYGSGFDEFDLNVDCPTSSVSLSQNFIFSKNTSI